MRILSYILSLLLIACTLQVQAQKEDFRKKAPKPAPARPIEMGTYESFKLDNGLQVIVVENHKLPRVSFQLTVDLPMIKEGEYAGTADLAGQLLNKGTATRTKAQIDEAVDFIGATLNSGEDGLFGASLSKHKGALLELMSDILLHPNFPADEFDKLKKQTLSNLALSKDDPEAIANNLSTVLRYGKSHPYGELTTEKSVDRITVDMCKAYYEQYFKPEISYLVIVGDIKLADAKALATKYFAQWKKGTVMQEHYTAPEPPAQTQVSFVDKTGAVQSVVEITMPIKLKPGSPELIKARLANAILGVGDAGRLFKNLREDKGYTYGAYSSLVEDRNVGYFSASANVRNGVTDSAIVQFLYELNRLRNEPVSEKELQLAKNVLTGSFARSLERPETMARFALNTARYKLPADYYKNYLQNLNAVTAADVQAMAQKYILPDRAHIIVVGSKDEVAGKLKTFSKSGDVHFYDAFGNKFEAVATAMPSDISAPTVIENYIKAIGGRDQLTKVNDLLIVMSTSVQGMALEMTLQQKKPGKMSMAVGMNGMTLNQTKYDGAKAAVLSMGQSQPVDEATIASLKEQAIMFPEMDYEKNGYKLELKGVDQLDGQAAYKIEVTSPAGKKVTEFYHTTSFLKLRTVAVETGPEGEITVINDFDNYQTVSGIQFPHKTRSTGMMPVPVVLEVKSIAVNPGIDDAVFKID